MTPIQKLSNQIERAIAMLPEDLEEHQVEALLMTIAQGYAPNLKTAVKVLLNAGLTLEDFVIVLNEAKTATKN